MPDTTSHWLARAARLAACSLVILQLAACSNYNGPITNAPADPGMNGLPGLTHSGPG